MVLFLTIPRLLFFKELNEAKALDFKKANEKIDSDEACFYEDMRDILNNPR